MMSEHEPPVAGEGRPQSHVDPREERLQALYTAAYLPLDPSEALEQRIERITAQPRTEPSRPRGGWLLPTVWTRAQSPSLQATLSLGAAGAGSFVVTLLAALLLSSTAAREPIQLAARPPAAREESPELRAHRAAWLSDPAPSLLPFPLTPPPQQEPVPPKPPRALPWRRSQRPGSSPTT